MLKELMVRTTFIACLYSVSFAAHALADAPKPVNIPAGNLVPALEALEKQEAVELVYQPEQLKAFRTGGVQGTYAPADAVRILLKGTPLELHTDPSGAMVIAAPRAKGALQDQGVPSTQEGKKSSSDEFRVAQVDQGQGQITGSVEAQHDESSKDNKENRKREELQEVVVTGTHIHDSANPTAPMIVIDRADIESSGYVTTQQLVASIPQNFGGGATGATEDGVLGSGAQVNYNDSYATGINLRGLGTSSTLILLNGHRLAPSAQGLFVDVSAIPLAAIERIEIMTDGASAIYGSDAVAGVVNFILRKDYQGQETWATYGSSAGNTRQQELVGQSVGRHWTDGAAVGTLQYQNLGALSASDRPYTASATPPTDLLPHSREYSATFNIQQDLPAGFDVASDILFSRSEKWGSTATPYYFTYFTPVTNDGVATVSVGYRPTERWRVEGSGSYSLENTAYNFLYPVGDIPSCGTSPCHTHVNYKVGSGEIIADGPVFHSFAGDARAAFGVSYRSEAFSDVLLWLPAQDTQFERHVSAEFAELEVPLVGASEAVPLLRQLDVSLAVRHDDYSDFGSTTNPRYGLSWRLVDGLHFRTAYSTSFRAPNAYEASYGRGLFSYLYNTLFASPTGGTVPVLWQVYTPDAAPLQPERSRNFTAGVDFEPPALRSLKASLDYFDIRYRDRIVTPSFDANALSEPDVYGSLITPVASDAAAQALIDQTISQGGTFYDALGTGASGVRYLLHGQEQNAALVVTNGLDITISDHVAISDNEFRIALNATYIHEILTSYTATTAQTDLVNTYANPLHWRRPDTLISPGHG